VERFRNIWGREFNYNLLPTFGRVLRIFQAKESVLTKALLPCENRGNKNFCELVNFEEELKKRASDRGRVDEW
jgi:hypothetical protein